MSETEGYSVEAKEAAMPRGVEKIRGGQDSVMPLRVTRRTGRFTGRGGGTKESDSIRVRCGCCKEAIVIAAPDSDSSAFDPLEQKLEINGVYATVSQWQELLCPLLGLQPNFDGREE